MKYCFWICDTFLYFKNLLGILREIESSDFDLNIIYHFQ